MFITEKQMDLESTFTLLLNPYRGLNYQCVGAFQRLGRKVLAYELVPSARPTDTALPLVKVEASELARRLELDIQWIVYARNSFEETSFSEDWEPLHRLRAQAPHARWIFCLPLQDLEFYHSHIDSSWKAQSTLLHYNGWIWGFRDSGIFDFSLDLFKQSPRLLRQSSRWDPQSLLLNFVGDISSLICSVPLLTPSWGKSIQIPSQSVLLKEWRESFCQSFLIPELKSFEKYWSLLDSTVRDWERFCSEKPSANAPLLSISMNEVFPSPLSSLPRALQTCANAYQKTPELELVFPPSRGL